MSDSEWYGELHILIVRSVRLPDGPNDDGELTDYDLEHPPSCQQEDCEDWGGVTCKQYSCDAAWYERQSDLAFSLRYSGTPITEPGTYRIQGWGRKSYIWEYGAYEYDGGVGVVSDEEAAS